MPEKNVKFTCGCEQHTFCDCEIVDIEVERLSIDELKILNLNQLMLVQDELQIDTTDVSQDKNEYFELIKNYLFNGGGIRQQESFKNPSNLLEE